MLIIKIVLVTHIKKSLKNECKSCKKKTQGNEKKRLSKNELNTH